MSQAIHPAAHRAPFRHGVRVAFACGAALALATLSPTFANRLLSLAGSALGFEALGTMFFPLLILAILLFAVIASSEQDTDDPLIMLALAGVLTFAGAALLLAVASAVAPNNGWSHLVHVADLQSTKASIEIQKGDLTHPANRRVVQALASMSPAATRAAEQWFDDQELLGSTQTDRVLLALSLLGQANTPLARDIARRGWVGKDDLAKLHQWAVAHPVPNDASTLHANAWLHLVGEKPWSDALDAPGPSTKEDQS